MDTVEFALHYVCPVVLCVEATGSVAAGAWAQGSSEIQSASGCRMTAVTQMKTADLGRLLSFTTTCSQHILVGTLSAGHTATISHNHNALHSDCYVSSVICYVLLLLIFTDRSVLGHGIIGIHSQYM